MQPRVSPVCHLIPYKIKCFYSQTQTKYAQTMTSHSEKADRVTSLLTPKPKVPKTRSKLVTDADLANQPLASGSKKLGNRKTPLTTKVTPEDSSDSLNKKRKRAGSTIETTAKKP